MCGLAGYIGQPKRPKMSYYLMTKLFDFLEFRGTDAAGVWGTETGNNGRVIYHKAPIKSSDFVQSRFWNRIRKVKSNLLLAHARATSRGGGDAINNENNHPFVSSDKRLGIIHNGTLDESNLLENKYEILSETDSEYLLRMYEQGLNATVEDVPDVSNRLDGVKEIWKHIDSGAMAVAIGERHTGGSRSLLLFRNDKRPLWLADLRESLGQIFFFSSPDIWYKAVIDDSKLVEVCQNAKLIEVPPQQVWYFRITPECPTVTPENVLRFKISVEDSNEAFDSKFHLVKTDKLQEIDVITDLDRPPKQKTSFVHHGSSLKTKAITEPSEKQLSEYDLVELMEPNSEKSSAHSTLCKEIIHIIKSIDVGATNICMESSMAENDYSMLMESLLQIKGDLQGTLNLLG